MIKHKENWLSINGKQSVKLEKRIIEFENHFKQIPVPFKIYADFECNLRGVECYEGSYTKKYQGHIPCSFAYKDVCVDDKFSKRIVVYRGENAVYEFIKAIVKEYKYCKKVMNKHFNKNLIMSEEEEHLFQQSNSCWICKKRIDNDEEKVRDHWRHGVVVITAAQLHSTKPELRFCTGSNPVRGVSEIRDGEDL